MAPKPYFRAIFLFFGYFFPIFWGRPFPIFSYFFLFRAGGPKPILWLANGVASLSLFFEPKKQAHPEPKIN